jgi:hypothetical protein
MWPLAVIGGGIAVSLCVVYLVVKLGEAAQRWRGQGVETPPGDDPLEGWDGYAFGSVPEDQDGGFS